MTINEKRGERKFDSYYQRWDRPTVGIVKSVNEAAGTVSGAALSGKEFRDARLFLAGGQGWLLGYMPQEGDMVMVFPIFSEELLLAFPLYLMYCGYDWMRGIQQEMTDDQAAKAFKLDDMITGRRVRKGEMFLQSVSGSELLMNRQGDVRLKNDINDLLELSSGFRSLIGRFQNSLDFKAGTSSMKFGVVRRPKEDAGQLELPLDFPNDPKENYEEFQFEVRPKDSTNRSWLNFRVGDVVEDDGQETDLRMRVIYEEQGEQKFYFDIEKDGTVTYKGEVLYLGFGEVGLGVEGQADSVSAKSKGYLILGSIFLPLYNAHVHPTAVGPTGPPAVLASPTTYLSQITYTK